VLPILNWGGSSDLKKGTDASTRMKEESCSHDRGENAVDHPCQWGGKIKQDPQGRKKPMGERQLVGVTPPNVLVSVKMTNVGARAPSSRSTGGVETNRAAVPGAGRRGGSGLPKKSKESEWKKKAGSRAESRMDSVSKVEKLWKSPSRKPTQPDGEDQAHSEKKKKQHRIKGKGKKEKERMWP